MPKARQPPQGLLTRLTVSARGLAVMFTECSLESETEVLEHREGGARGGAAARKLPGKSKWSNVTLQRGLDASRELWDWRDAVAQGRADARADGKIEFLDHTGTAVATFNFQHGWPVKYSVSTLSSPGTDVVTETIELSVEQVERV